MQTRKPHTPTETRQRMIAQGLDPERIRRILEASATTQHQNFMTLYPLLSKEDRIDMEIDLMQTELALSIVRRACLFFLIVPQLFF